MGREPAGRRIVYSTDPNWRPEPPAGPPPVYPAAAKQTARIWRDSKRRRGKTVTVVGGLQHDPATLEDLLKRLKQQWAPAAPSRRVSWRSRATTANEWRPPWRYWATRSSMLVVEAVGRPTGGALLGGYARAQIRAPAAMRYAEQV